MEDVRESKRTGVRKGLASVLNASGKALVVSYDASVNTTKKLVSAAKCSCTVQDKPRERAKTSGPGFFASAASRFFGPSAVPFMNEVSRLKAKIKEYEDIIASINFEISRDGSIATLSSESLKIDALEKKVNLVRQYEQEVIRLKAQLTEFREKERIEAENKRQKVLKSLQRPVQSPQQVERNVTNAIEKAVTYGIFDSSSERAIFEKVAFDLLDPEVEIKILAATELGKMKNLAAAPVLIEAERLDNNYLTTEIINSLVNIGDLRAMPLFKEKLHHKSFRIRMGALRGLYKLADGKYVQEVLLDALRDEHPEVRKTAVTFLGWKDDISVVPSLVQSLKDEDERVRKAAIAALINLKDDASVGSLIKALGDKVLEVREKALEAVRAITGEDVSFNVQLTGAEVEAAIIRLRDWWHNKRFGGVDIEPEGEAPVETAPVRDETAEAGLPAVHEEVGRKDIPATSDEVGGEIVPQSLDIAQYHDSRDIH